MNTSTLSPDDPAFAELMELMEAKPPEGSPEYPDWEAKMDEFHATHTGDKESLARCALRGKKIKLSFDTIGTLKAYRLDWSRIAATSAKESPLRKVRLRSKGTNLFIIRSTDAWNPAAPRKVEIE